MNRQPTTKYKQVPNDIEKNTLSSKASRERLNFSRLEKISREKNRLEKFDKKITREKNSYSYILINIKKIRSLLEVGEKVLILAAQLKKKNSLGKFYKSNVDNKSYFHKQETFLIMNKQKIDGKLFYWLKSSRTEKNVKCRFQREEIFAISDNFN